MEQSFERVRDPNGKRFFGVDRHNVDRGNRVVVPEGGRMKTQRDDGEDNHVQLHRSVQMHKRYLGLRRTHVANAFGLLETVNTNGRQEDSNDEATASK